MELGKQKGEKILIGFAAETESMVENAEEKRRKKNLDFIVVNDVSREDIGFQAENNEVKVIGENGQITDLPLLSKEVLAHQILDRIPALRSCRMPKEVRGKG
jgi:phosphopantothenoylcysteine decarboxylase/phosphopantothenate--cysteine ligase